jgi:hypothetical protein
MNNRISSVVNKLFSIESDGYVFIYTPPKVGSTTLVSSLRVSLGNTYSIVHIHDEIMLNVLTGVADVSINEIIEFLSSSGKRVYVIDVYRTPIERKMSEFFEKIADMHFNTTEENLNNYNINKIINRFNKIFPYLANDADYFKEKYSLELPENFDFEKKYLIQEKDNITYIKLRLRDSSEWDKILQEIFDVNVVIISDYKTDNKPINRLYSQFKNEYRLPSNLATTISNCKYLNYYYISQEKEEYLNTWLKKTTTEVTPYTQQEYDFYINVSLENKIYNSIQREHYIDNGCLCDPCQEKRREIFYKAKNGVTTFEKNIHRDTVAEYVNNVNLKIVNKVNVANRLITNAKNMNKPNKLKHNLLTKVMNQNVIHRTK